MPCPEIEKLIQMHIGSSRVKVIECFTTVYFENGNILIAKRNSINEIVSYVWLKDSIYFREILHEYIAPILRQKLTKKLQ